MTFDITEIVLASLGVIVDVLLVLLATKVVPYIRARVSSANMTIIIELVYHAVHAAEQLFKGSGHGADKLEYVLSVVHEALAARGIVINDVELRAYIEAAVLRLKDEFIAGVTADESSEI